MDPVYKKNFWIKEVRHHIHGFTNNIFHKISFWIVLTYTTNSTVHNVKPLEIEDRGKN